MNRRVTDELAPIRKLLAKPSKPDGAYTTQELVQELGISRWRLDDFLRQLDHEGKLESVMVYRRARDRKMRPVPVYWLRKTKDRYVKQRNDSLVK